MKIKRKLIIPVFFFLLSIGLSGCLREILNSITPINDKVQDILDEEANASKVSLVSLSSSSLSLTTGESYTLKATSKDSASKTTTDTYTWTTSNSSVATVSNGTVKGIAKGTATITATSNTNSSKYASCIVTVTNPSTVYSVYLSYTNLSLNKGETYSITATSKNSYGDKISDTYTWTSSNSSVATVSGGYITAVSPGTATIKATSKSNTSKYASCTVTVSAPVITANQFFWGTWVRMDNGIELIVDETYVSNRSFNNHSEFLQKSNEEQLYFEYSIDGISSLTKSTANIVTCKIGDAIIPLYRKGGTNLSYSLKVVGFTDDSSDRAASSVMKGRAGLKVKGSSKRFSTFENEGTTDENGSVTLISPIQGDIQTVSVQVSDDETIYVENLKIDNDGSYMGAVPIVNDDDPVLKVSGYIDEAQKTDGYMYSNHTYVMTVHIKNIGSVPAKPTVLEIKSDDDSIISIEGIDSTDGISNPNAYTIPTLKEGVTLEKKIRVNVKSFTEAYINSKIIVNIHSLTRTWEDYIPLRVYSGNAIFTIAASSEMNNTGAALNGFIIYPDGNNQFFTVSHADSKQIKVPRFMNTDSYILVFSGATTDGELDNTTELFYTVSFDSTKKNFTYNSSSINAQEKIALMYYGEGASGNETEDTAFPVTDAFEAYISEGEIDFYKVNLTD